MSVFFYLALLFGGSLAAGLALTGLHDLLVGVWERRKRSAATPNPTVLKPLTLPRGEASAPIITVRLRSAVPTPPTLHPDAIPRSAPDFPNAA